MSRPFRNPELLAALTENVDESIRVLKRLAAGGVKSLLCYYDESRTEAMHIGPDILVIVLEKEKKKKDQKAAAAHALLSGDYVTFEEAKDAAIARVERDRPLGFLFVGKSRKSGLFYLSSMRPDNVFGDEYIGSVIKGAGVAFLPASQEQD